MTFGASIFLSFMFLLIYSLGFTVGSKQKPFIPTNMILPTYTVFYEPQDDGWVMKVFKNTEPEMTLILQQNVRVK